MKSVHEKIDRFFCKINEKDRYFEENFNDYGISIEAWGKWWAYFEPTWLLDFIVHELGSRRLGSSGGVFGPRSFVMPTIKIGFSVEVDEDGTVVNVGGNEWQANVWKK